MRDADVQRIEPYRVREIEICAERDRVLVAENHRKPRFEAEVLHGHILALRRDPRLGRHGLVESGAPLEQFRVLADVVGAEQANRVDVFERCCLDHGRLEAVGRVVENDEIFAVERQRPEKARFRVADGFEFAGGELEAENIGNPREVGTAEQVFAVGRKHEAFGHRLVEIKALNGFKFFIEQIIRIEDLENLLALDVAERTGEQRSVGRNVEIVRHRAVWQGLHLVPLLVWIGNAHDRRVAVQVPNAPDRTVGRVEYDLADACILEQHLALATPQIDGHQVAVSVVVRRVENRFRRLVVSDRRHAVDHRYLDVLELAHGSRFEIEFADVSDHARVANTRDQAVAVGIVVGPGYRAQRTIGEIAVLGRRVLTYTLEVRLLKLALELDPVLPGIVERFAVYALEVFLVPAVAVVGALDPVDELVRAILVREVTHEAAAVKIGIGADLEIDLGAFGDEAERVVEMAAVPYLGAEHHLVITALRAAEAAGHPGFRENGDALEVPARRRFARRRQVLVQDRFRVFVGRKHLAAEELARSPVGCSRLVHRRYMDELMVHQRVHALRGCCGFKRQRDRRHVDNDRVARIGAGAGVAVVRKVS